MENRKLGFWETVCKFGHDYFYGTGNIASIASFQGKINPEQIIKYLRFIFDRHPLLRAVIKEVSYALFFEFSANFNDIPIKLIKKESPEAWKFYIEEEVRQRFPIENHLWRAALIYSEAGEAHEIIITYHHAIADGLSSIQIIKELLTLCATEALVPLNSSSLPLKPCIEQMLAYKNTWDIFLKQKAYIKKVNFDPWAYQEFIALKHRRTRYIYKHLPQHYLEDLHSRCRQQKTTINAALNAAMLLTAQRMKNQVLTTSLHTPVNLRSYCNPPLSEQHLGCYISMVTTVHENIQPSHSFWELARAYRQQLQEHIPSLGFCPTDFHIANFDIEALIDLFDMPGSTRRDHFSAGFGITNLGALDIPSNFGDLTLDYFMFHTNRAMGDYVIFLHVLTFRGIMYFCFCYTEPLISTDRANEFAKIYMQILLENK